MIGNRASSVEKYLRNSLADLKLDYIDLYLIHTPFAVPDITDGQFQKHENGDLVLDLESNHIETWKVNKNNLCVHSNNKIDFTIKNIPP